MSHEDCQDFEQAEDFIAAARMAVSFVMPLDEYKADTNTLPCNHLMLCSAALLLLRVSCIQIGMLLALCT